MVGPLAPSVLPGTWVLQLNVPESCGGAGRACVTGEPVANTIRGAGVSAAAFTGLSET